MLRRLVLALIFAPGLAGCMGYVYPTLVYTPEQPIENENGSAHAFRVDIDRTERKPKPSTVEFTLMRIPLDSRGIAIVPSQLEVTPVSGVYNPFGLAEGVQHERTDYTIHVRLYRPEFETKEIRAWDRSRSAKWTPARDLLAQEKAIDDLLAAPTDPPAKGTWWEAKENPSFQPGKVSNSEHESLMFASREYQRLANSPMAGAANMTEVRARLIQKAIFLSRFAEPGEPVGR